MNSQYFIDLSGVRSRQEIHQRLRQALPLPQWYGDNLDSLYDVLTEWNGPAELVFQNWAGAKEAGPEYMDRLRRMLGDACRENPALTVEFQE